jgi:bla regulator protein BlaR1
MPTRRSLRVLESPEFTNPCTWGFIRPVLLLPAGGESWTEAERRLALLHELAHVRR